MRKKNGNKLSIGMMVEKRNMIPNSSECSDAIVEEDDDYEFRTIGLIATILLVVAGVGSSTGLGMILMGDICQGSFVSEFPNLFWPIWIACITVVIGICLLEKHFGDELFFIRSQCIYCITAEIIGLVALAMCVMVDKGIICIISESFSEFLMDNIFGPMGFNLVTVFGMILVVR